MGELDSQYVSIQRVIWYKSQFKSLSDDAKLLFLYLDTCPHGNMIGFYVLPIGYGCEDLKWDRERFTEGLHELLDKQLIGYDFDSSVVLDLHHILKFPPQNPNQVKAAIKKFNDLPVNTLNQAFYDMAKQLPEGFIEPLLECIAKRLGESVTVTVTVTVPVTEPVTETSGEPQKDETVITPTMSEAIPIAQLMYDKILIIDPKFKASESKLKGWAADIEKLIRLDARSPDEIKAVVEWVYQDQFWKGNILSGGKLREKFTQLLAQTQRKNGNAGRFTNGEDFRRKYEAGEI